MQTKSSASFVPFVFCIAAVVLNVQHSRTAGFRNPRTANGEWRFYSGDNGATKYSPLDQINKENVETLRVAWRRPHVDASLLAAAPDIRPLNNFRSTPIMVDGVLYASNGVGVAEAFDP